jgi:bifunctional enzyme CysN/CysC
MAVAASLADVALLVVDAVRGIRQQTLRHAAVCRIMGVRSFVVAINKIDAVENSEVRFAELRSELEERLIDFPRVEFVAVSGLRGDNVTGDESLLSALVDGIAPAAEDSREFRQLRIPVQTVLRETERRWFAGRIASGQVSVGDSLSIWPSGSTAIVRDLVVAGTGSASRASAGASVAIELDRETDIGRGDMLVDCDTELPISRAHLADLVWLDEEGLDPAASYVLRVGPLEVPARVEQVRFVLDLEAGEEVPSQSIRVNDIGRVEITADRPLLLDRYSDSRHTGGFILCDRLTGRTMAAGMAVHPLQRESDVVRHAFTVTREARESLNGVRAGVLWLTGLPGSGKSTIADEVEKSLFERGIRAYVLDGDTVRQTLSEDLGFSPEDRRENVRRVARTAQLMMDAGLIVIVSLVSPFRADREAARELFAHADFAEVFVDTPLAVCQERDPKGLYAKAATTKDSQMTGAGQSYEAPLKADLHLDGTRSVVDNTRTLIDWIMSRRAR